LILQPAVGDGWFSLIDRCDIVALPYDPVRYQAAYSAIVGEALAAGAVLVGPAGTTISKALDSMGGPGTTFSDWSAASIADGIGRAIDQFDDLADRAYHAGTTWHGMHGPDRFAEAVLAAAGFSRPKRRMHNVMRHLKSMLGGLPMGRR
jgi:hypothetical protein